MMRKLVSIAATVVVVAIGLAAGAVDARPASPAFPPDRPTRVLILGDSVPAGAVQQFQTALGTDRDVVVEAKVNRSTNEGADLLAGELGTDWDVVVVMLGHNDGGSPGVFQPAARRILDQLKDVPWVSWMSIHEVRDYYPGVNDYIESLTAEYPNLHIADWDPIAEANPDGIASDGLHLGPQGAFLMAGLAAEQVRQAEAQQAGELDPTTTTTTEATTTTTEAPDDEPDETTTTEAAAADDTAPPEPEGQAPPADAPTSDDDGSILPVVALIVAGVLLIGASIVTVVLRRRRIGDQMAADLG